MRGKRLLSAAALVLVLCAALLSVPKLRTQLFVALYHEQIERSLAADGSVPADDAVLFGYRSVNSWDDGENPITEFMLGARGFLLMNARYFGCFYSPKDMPAAFQNAAVPLHQEGEDCWVWQGEGDNCGTVEKLREQWYYFEARF